MRNLLISEGLIYFLLILSNRPLLPEKWEKKKNGTHPLTITEAF
jgi:hypothetical protein